MPSQSFLQLFGLFAQMADRRAQREQAERGLDLQEEQLNQAVKQFEVQHKDKDTADALKALASASSEGRQALLQLFKSGHFSQQELEAFSKFAAGQPIDPSVLGAQSAQAGYAAATPQQRGVMDQEAAARATSGQSVGGMGTSQLVGALATGGAPPGQMAEQFSQPAVQGANGQTISPSGAQQWGNLIQQFASRTAMGAPQQQYDIAWAQLRQEDRKILVESGLKELFGKSAMELTPTQRVEGLKGIADILDSMNKNTSDVAGNLARQRVINVLSPLLGLNPGAFVPVAGAAQEAPTAAGPFRVLTAPIRRPGVAPAGPISTGRNF